jgi:hypothetical protein
MSMVLTLMDHAGPANPGGAPPLCTGGSGAEQSCGDAGDQVPRLAGIGRELSYNDYQAGKHSNGRGERDDRNLIVPLGRPFPCPSAPAECGPSG